MLVFEKIPKSKSQYGPVIDSHFVSLKCDGLICHCQYEDDNAQVYIGLNDCMECGGTQSVCLEEAKSILANLERVIKEVEDG